MDGEYLLQEAYDIRSKAKRLARQIATLRNPSTDNSDKRQTNRRKPSERQLVELPQKIADLLAEATELRAMTEEELKINSDELDTFAPGFRQRVPKIDRIYRDVHPFAITIAFEVRHDTEALEMVEEAIALLSGLGSTSPVTSAKQDQ